MSLKYIGSMRLKKKFQAFKKISFAFKKNEIRNLVLLGTFA
jgi:hypothetical protein